MQSLLLRAGHAGVSLSLFVAVSGADLGAQLSAKQAVSPAGMAHVSGNANNNYPFYGMSSRYQQIHDAVDMQATTRSPTLLIHGMGFRPHGTNKIVARQWDVQLTLGHTTVPASQATTTFANNFTTTPTVVLPYKVVNGPAGQGLGSAQPNPVHFVFPFATPFTYIAPLGNLCWEWQHRNTPSIGSSPMDAVSNFTGAVTVGANYGKGCTASGQSSPATCNHAIAGGNINLALANGRAMAPAILWLGFQRTEVTLPGWCAPLYLTPLASVGGTTDASGAWASGSAPTALLNVAPYAEVYSQYGFLDGTLAGGIGLSDRGVVAAPAHGAQFACRVYAVNLTGNGAENVATGSVTRNFGLVVHFGIF